MMQCILSPELSEFLLNLHRSFAHFAGGRLHQNLSTSFCKKSLGSGIKKIGFDDFGRQADEFEDAGAKFTLLSGGGFRNCG